MIGEGLKMLTYPRHLWLLSSDDSLACHTYVYCVMGHPFIMVISEDPWHSRLLQRVWQCCHYLFLRLKVFEHPNFRLRGERANPLCHRCGPYRKLREPSFWRHLHSLYPKVLCAKLKFVQKLWRFSNLVNTVLLFHYFLPWKRFRSFICKKLNPMLRAKFCGNWL